MWRLKDPFAAYAWDCCLLVLELQRTLLQEPQASNVVDILNRGIDFCKALIDEQARDPLVEHFPICRDSYYLSEVLRDTDYIQPSRVRGVIALLQGLLGGTEHPSDADIEMVQDFFFGALDHLNAARARRNVTVPWRLCLPANLL